MKKIAMLALLTALASTTAFAQKSGGLVNPHAPATNHAQSGGFSGPKASSTTVEQAKTLGDDTWVTLQGTVEMQIGKGLYQFRDASGTINVEIDDKRWNGLMITPKDKVEIQGEVDKDWNSVAIDVKQISKVQ
ncbi:YgiW/YdeI family stress tolerance OB fold protein [Budvicia diplopodorum]|uniref:YgiW/YdeI family stress tolerance OB fold protein n=1 Tax=Budvicia diplopodorum TaxID=1119056 RepID=UPI001358CF8F|nr:YgiW/YdeI family stress tolerance OB fold protein [Budvicia diplopodorum]